MTAFADLSEIANRITGGNSGTPDHAWHWIDNRIDAAAANATVAGRLTSLWKYNKSNGANGANPTTVAAPDRTTTGAMGQANAGSGREKWLLGLEAVASQIGTLILYDRLLHIGGLSGTTASPSSQTVGGTITRNTSGVGNMIAVEIYGQIGTTATTITASYSNTTPTSGRTTKAASIGGTGLREPERMIILPLQDGDLGVSAVASVTLAATTGTAGNFGITVMRPLAQISCGGVGMPMIRDFLSGLPNIPKIDDDACLAWAWLANGTTAPQIMVVPHMVER